MLRPGLKIALVVLLAQLCSSCRPYRTSLERHIKEIHSLSDTHPDSAFNEIMQINRHELSGKRLKAQFALTCSKILDKNYIDICSDSIIAPALDYYSSRGTGQEKAETYYYAARVEENAGNYEESLFLLRKAEQYFRDDNRLAALIYSSKARLYYNTLLFDAAGRNYRTAAEYYLQTGETDRYASNRLKEADCAIKSDDIQSAEKIAEEVWELRNDISSKTLNKYFQIMIFIAEECSIGKALSHVSRYIDQFGSSPYMDWLLVSRIYLEADEIQAAEAALERHPGNYPLNAPYYYQKARLLEIKGMHKEALDAYRKYIELHSRIGSDILSKDTKFIEERGMHQEMHEREKIHRTILSLGICVSFLALALAALTIITIRKQLKIETLQRENLQIQLDELLSEREELAMLQTKNQEGRRIISERLRIIDQFVMSDAFNDSIFEAKASGTLQKIISDREEFVRQNRLIFNQSSPEFITYLEERGLDDREIDHCCLYAIGMNGKMVTAFTNIKRHYHIGSGVRKKLGLSGHDTNISIHIRNLFKEFESVQTEG